MESTGLYGEPYCLFSLLISRDYPLVAFLTEDYTVDPSSNPKFKHKMVNAHRDRPVSSFEFGRFVSRRYYFSEDLTFVNSYLYCSGSTWIAFR